MYLASSSPLEEKLNQDEGFEMDVFATNTSVSSNSWDLLGGGYTSPGGFGTRKNRTEQDAGASYAYADRSVLDNVMSSVVRTLRRLSQLV